MVVLHVSLFTRRTLMFAYFAASLILPLVAAFASTDASPQPELALQTAHTGSVYTAVFSHDGKYVASGSQDNSIRLWNTHTGDLVRTLTGHNGAVKSLSFSPDDKFLASGSDDGTIRIWRVPDGAMLQRWVADEDTVQSVRFSPDGKVLVSGGGDNAIKVWLPSSGR